MYVIQTLLEGTSAMSYLNEGWTVLWVYTQKQHITVHQRGRKFYSAVHVVEASDMRVYTVG
jgi:hypothetical protein